LSPKYSSSPELRLRIGKSRSRQALYLGLCFTTCYALFLLHRDGYTCLCLPLFPLATFLLWRLRRPTLSVVELCWRQGVWTIESAYHSQLIIPGARSTVLPWVIYLPVSVLSEGRKGCLWIFLDSVPGEHWRQLRARLNLGVGQSEPGFPR
jgi:hypothetical protein